MTSEQCIDLIAEELKDICDEGRDIPNEYTSDVLSLIEAYKMEKGSVDEWQNLAARRATRMTELMNEVDRLKAENEALKKDAERYRYLRSGNCSGHEEESATVMTDDQSAYYREDLDKLIDRQMAAFIEWESQP